MFAGKPHISASNALEAVRFRGRDFRNIREKLKGGYEKGPVVQESIEDGFQFVVCEAHDLHIPSLIAYLSRNSSNRKGRTSHYLRLNLSGFADILPLLNFHRHHIGQNRWDGKYDRHSCVCFYIDSSGTQLDLDWVFDFGGGNFREADGCQSQYDDLT